MAFRRNNPVRLRAGRRRATDWGLGFGTNALQAIPAATKVLVASIAATTITNVAPHNLI